MATRYRHATSGAVVSVRDDKAMDSDWVPAESEEKPAQKRTAKKAAAKPSADSK